MFAGAGWFALLGIQFPGRCESISATARCRVRTVSGFDRGPGRGPRSET